MKEKFFLITKQSSLARIQDLLEQYEMYDLFDENMFLLFGYRTLSTEAKETYKLLRNLQKTISKKNHTSYIEISLDYLSCALNTSEDAQSDRLKKLEEHSLVKKVKRAYSINRYYIFDPVPDSTFLFTICNLIRRSKLSKAISKYECSNNPKEKITCLIEIKRLVNRGAKHFKLPKLKHLLD